MGGAIWQVTLRRKLGEYLPTDAKSSTNKIFGSLVVAKTYTEGSGVRIAINHAYRDSMSLLALVSTACMVPMLAVMIGIKNMNLREVKEKKPRE